MVITNFTKYDMVYGGNNRYCNSNNFITVYCQPNLEEIQNKYFPIFDILEKSLPQVYSYCLSLGDWTLNYQSQNNSIATYQLPRVSGYEMIEQVASDYNQEIWFDTKNKILYVYDKMGVNFGAFYSNELRLKNLVKQSSSYDYFTVLYPIGKNGLTIGFINNNQDFLSNFTYTNKHIEKYVYYDDVTQLEILKSKGEKLLEENCAPKASYKLYLSDLGDKIQLGDTIYLADKLKHIKQKQRVVKIIRYPESPEKDTVEISNLQVDFARDFVKSQKRIEKEILAIKQKLVDLTEN